MKSAVTLCHVAEAATGPFVFHGPIAEGFAKAAAHDLELPILSYNQYTLQNTRLADELIPRLKAVISVRE